jgi:RNA polymerase sigma-70 factor (ECF subfamily)
MNLEPVIDDAVLLDGLRRGDDHAFATLVRQHGGRMLATARRFLRDDEAEDAVQEAFVSAVRAIGGFAGDSKLSTWLHRVVVNTALMRLRSRRRRREEPIDDLLPRFDADGYHAEAVVGWETPSDVLLEQRQTREMVRRCIDQLPEQYRTVILLRDIEEMDTEETARSIGSTPNAVKIRLHRARQALRTLLARELGRSEHGRDDAPAPAAAADQGRRRA